MDPLEKDIAQAVAQVWSVFGRRWWFALEREDATQQAFMACWSARHRFDPARASATTFFSLIARQEITRMNRDLRRREMQSLNIEVGESEEEAIAFVEAPEGRDLPVENELVDLVEAAMDENLSAFQADTVRRIMAGETATEIARDRGTSHQAVSRQYQTGLARVRETIS